MLFMCRSASSKMSSSRKKSSNNWIVLSTTKPVRLPYSISTIIYLYRIHNWFHVIHTELYQFPIKTSCKWCYSVYATYICVPLWRFTFPASVLASSTSCFPASSFTEDLVHRSQCLVAHPVNPPYYVPLVEIVPAPWTDPKVLHYYLNLFPRDKNRESESWIIPRRFVS